MAAFNHRSPEPFTEQLGAHQKQWCSCSVSSPYDYITCIFKTKSMRNRKLLTILLITFIEDGWSGLEPEWLHSIVLTLLSRKTDKNI